jgi:hypothetical protein
MFGSSFRNHLDMSSYWVLDMNTRFNMPKKSQINEYSDSPKNVSRLGLTSQCENREDVWMRSIEGGTQHIANVHNHKPISMPFFHIDPVWWWIDLNKLHHLWYLVSLTMITQCSNYLHRSHSLMNKGQIGCLDIIEYLHLYLVKHYINYKKL